MSAFTKLKPMLHSTQKYQRHEANFVCKFCASSCITLHELCALLSWVVSPAFRIERRLYLCHVRPSCYYEHPPHCLHVQNRSWLSPLRSRCESRPDCVVSSILYTSSPSAKGWKETNVKQCINTEQHPLTLYCCDSVGSITQWWIKAVQEEVGWR